MGACGVCRVKVLSGEIHIPDDACLSDGEKADGYALVCVGTVKGAEVLDQVIPNLEVWGLGSPEDGSRLEKRIDQPQPPQDTLAATADELAADAVSRIMACLPHRDRDSPLTEPKAQRQSRQATADDGDGF